MIVSIVALILALVLAAYLLRGFVCFLAHSVNLAVLGMVLLFVIFVVNRMAR